MYGKIAVTCETALLTQVCLTRCLCEKCDGNQRCNRLTSADMDLVIWNQHLVANTGHSESPCEGRDDGYSVVIHTVVVVHQKLFCETISQSLWLLSRLQQYARRTYGDFSVEQPFWIRR